MASIIDFQGAVAQAREAVKPSLSKLADSGKLVLKRIDEMEEDGKKTLEALAKETDPVVQRTLQEDLELILPARREAILALLATSAGSSADAAGQAALDVAVRVGVAAGKAFLGIK